MKIGNNSYNFCMAVHAQRIKLAERSLREGAKQAQIDMKAFRKAVQEKDVNLEGQLYGAIIAD